MTRFNLKTLRITEKTVPWLFALLVGLAYGMGLFQTGFFWDDWPFAWAARFMGPGNFLGSFARIRPFLGPIFLLTTSLLPATPLAWQGFALLIRFLITLAAWWAFRNIWPGQPWQSLLVALCFLVYPAYSQHWVAVTHINQELIPFLFYILSFGMTGLALRSATGARRRTVLALLLLAMGVFPTEYFISVEPLRFLFIISILGEQSGAPSTRFLRALKAWLPYLAVWGANAAWLYFYYHSGVYANYEVVVGSIAPSWGGIVSNFFVVSAEAVYKAGLLAWVQLPILAAQAISAPSTWAVIGVVGLVFVILLFFFRQMDPGSPFSSSQTWALQAILIGVVGILLGRIPSWAAGLPLTLQSSMDRFTISMLPGASLLVSGLLTFVFRKSRLWFIAAAMIIALGAGQQAFNANIFRRDWERQRSLYWQFAWRIPALKPGTLLLTDEIEFNYETDYSLTAPINWIYAPDFQPPKLPYMVLGLDQHPNRLPPLESGTDLQLGYRPVRFYGNTANVVAFIFPSSGCLRILDPVYDREVLYSQPAPVLTQITRFSDPSLILTGAAGPAMPEAIFGSEPPQTWCTYYTKAELARQRGEWGVVVQLGLEAAKKGFSPSDPVEWLPFIEAQVNTGQIDAAEKLARQTVSEKLYLRKAVCSIWARAQQKTPLIKELPASFNCK